MYALYPFKDSEFFFEFRNSNSKFLCHLQLNKGAFQKKLYSFLNSANNISNLPSAIRLEQMLNRNASIVIPNSQCIDK